MKLILLQLLIILNIILTTSIKDEPLDINTSQSLKIALHSGFGGRSHIKAILDIGEVLNKRGHKVVYVALEDNMNYLKGYSINNFTLGPPMMNEQEIREIMKLNLSKKKQILDPMKRISTSLIPIVEKSYKTLYYPLLDYLKEYKPDLLVCDFASHPCLDTSRQLGIPLIIGLQTTDLMGFLTAPYITKSMGYGPIYTNEMGFIERFNKLVIEYIIELRYLIPFNNKINRIKKLYNLPQGKDVFGDLNYGLLIANTFVGFEPAIPINPNMFQVGPIISDNKELLTPELEEFLNSHKNNLFIAFGSNSVLTKDIASKILEAAIQALDKRIIGGMIWGLGRTKESDFPEYINNGKSNIKISQLFNNEHADIKLLPWAPQVAILEHQNTKAFISHGGSESSFEALLSGTPILCLPLFGDQFRNARKLEDMGVAKFVDLDSFTPSSLFKQIEQVIQDKDDRIKGNLIKMKTLVHHNSKRKEFAADLFEQHAYIAMACRAYDLYVKDSNIPPCEVKHLIPISENMGSIRAYNIDVYVVAGLLSCLTIYFLVLLTWNLLRIMFFKQSNVKEKHE